MIAHDVAFPAAKLGFCLLPLPSGEVGMPLGMTGEGIAPKTPMPSPENRAACLSTSPEGRGKKSAFSLVELSIVLVILGLLTGGILAGQSLIRASELRSITTQFNQYVTSTQSFRDKYMALPGDMPNATRFWGAADPTPATCRTTASTSIATCDGNGDGRIADNAGSNEAYRFWQQLANAGLVEGNYSGITQGSTVYSSTAANSPRGKISNSLWSSYYASPQSANPSAFDGQYNNFMELGMPIANEQPIGPILKPEEIWNIDTKMDDGKPGTGKLVARASPLSSCTTATGSTAAQAAAISSDYLLTGTSVACALIFRDLF